jgi:hypothetical protein
LGRASLPDVRFDRAYDAAHQTAPTIDKLDGATKKVRSSNRLT